MRPNVVFISPYVQPYVIFCSLHVQYDFEKKRKETVKMGNVLTLTNLYYKNVFNSAFHS